MRGLERGDSNFSGASMLKMKPTPTESKKVKIKNPITVVHIISPISGVQS